MGTASGVSPLLLSSVHETPTTSVSPDVETLLFREVAEFESRVEAQGIFCILGDRLGEGTGCVEFVRDAMPTFHSECFETITPLFSHLCTRWRGT